MIRPVLVASTPIDDFLAGAGSASAAGERLESIGAAVALGGVVLSVGIVVFLAAVHAGPRHELTRLLRVLAGAGALMLVGGMVEAVGTAEILGLGWSDVLTDGSASSAMMRLLGGFLVLLGFVEETIPFHGHDGRSSGGDADDAATASVRWFPGAGSAFGLAGVALGVMSFAFDGHTVTEGPRIVHAAVNTVHVVAGGIWFGGVVGLVLVGRIGRRDPSVGPMLVRFSPIATGALATVFVAGVAMAAMILDGVGELVDTEWGRRLLVKTAGVGAAALVGAYHRFAVVPAVRSDCLTDDPAAQALAARPVGRTLAIQASLLTFVVVMSALLSGASTV